jgi:hypothetical protein
MAGILVPFLRAADFLGRRETEIGQHEDDLLLVGSVALIMDDKGSGHEQLLLQTLVRVHPERSAEAQWKVVIGASARWYRWSRYAGHAVLLPGRRQTVPMDQARFADLVFHPDAKPRARPRHDAGRSVGLRNSEHRRGLAVDLDPSALEPQHGHRRSVCVRARG